MGGGGSHRGWLGTPYQNGCPLCLCLPPQQQSYPEPTGTGGLGDWGTGAVATDIRGTAESHDGCRAHPTVRPMPQRGLHSIAVLWSPPPPPRFDAFGCVSHDTTAGRGCGLRARLWGGRGGQCTVGPGSLFSADPTSSFWPMVLGTEGGACGRGCHEAMRRTISVRSWLRGGCVKMTNPLVLIWWWSWWRCASVWGGGGGMGMGGWSSGTEYPASTITCLTVLRWPLWTREASGDRHCRSRSTGEPVMRRSVRCALTAADTLGGWGGAPRVTAGAIRWDTLRQAPRGPQCRNGVPQHPCPFGGGREGGGGCREVGI